MQIMAKYFFQTMKKYFLWSWKIWIEGLLKFKAPDISTSQISEEPWKLNKSICFQWSCSSSEIFFFFLPQNDDMSILPMVEILSDKIVNSAEGTNLLIEEGPQTMKTEIV